MAVNIALFGENIYGVRLGSLILALASLLIIYQTAKALYDRTTAYIATFLMAIHGTLIELGAGEISSDHVELTFAVLFMLTSFLITKLKVAVDMPLPLLISIGFLSGMVFLTKWQVSFFLFPLLFFILYNKPSLIRQKIKATFTIILVFLATTVPWPSLYDH